ncbi:Ohr family peroxiredoxin [Corynebacterium uberis]|uniref:Ohr family peroxiredoxin n=1 Tax=Corynebacterium TaxID=1716 RepID=UPI001D0A9E15|nr:MULTISPECIES: Ohr family peroxiredoxin [Corynebacterium]MCZ9309927.1 Ohr family peroxiredoxin [Corynebacterium sp. c6VSa_13]UDL73152.1 Ohr family peroxiredoxin [Corynebacterium uberis]UDL75971.1 Ohr family peroxiredoxin [Corynebacterium uberis]UDL78183.1 Ohr family peroxiredoxin [Corynebacterium uberis]UDL80466.1 Ohr family peroxiredoxin [Corynebacterium uberis]
MADRIYAQKVTSTGAGRDGHVKGEGGIDFDVRPPKAGTGVNPESLFAAAWAACFNGALRKMMEDAGVDTEKFSPEVDAEVALNNDPSGVGFRLSGVVTARFANQDELDNAEELVAKAHDFCPFSKAVRGEFDAEAKLG